MSANRIININRWTWACCHCSSGPPLPDSPSSPTSRPNASSKHTHRHCVQTPPSPSSSHYPQTLHHHPLPPLTPLHSFLTNPSSLIISSSASTSIIPATHNSTRNCRTANIHALRNYINHSSFQQWAETLVARPLVYLRTTSLRIGSKTSNHPRHQSASSKRPSAGNQSREQNTSVVSQKVQGKLEAAFIKNTMQKETRGRKVDLYNFTDDGKEKKNIKLGPAGRI